MSQLPTGQLWGRCDLCGLMFTRLSPTHEACVNCAVRYGWPHPSRPAAEAAGMAVAP